MSEANASAIHGPYRRKVTLACDSCRKRRVKCSGTQPCTFCSDSRRQCAFDSKNRGRRGPRPRQPASQVPRVTQQLAPRRPSLESTSTVYIEPSLEAPVEAPVEIAITPSIEPTIHVSVEPVWMPSDLPRVEEIDKFDDESAGEGDDALDPVQWKPILEQLLSPISITDTYEQHDEIYWARHSELTGYNSLPELDMDLMCHLIELFCTRTNTQFKSLLSPAQVNEQILQRTISRGLLLAICASSMRFSVHKAAREPHCANLAQLMGDEARNCVQSSTPDQPQINNIRTMCILVDFEASRACGRRAWMDIAMGRSLVQLARTSRHIAPDWTQILDAAELHLIVAELSHSIGHPSLQPPSHRRVKRPRPDTRVASFPEGTRRLLDLLEVLIGINQLGFTPYKEHNPAPWNTDSDFRALQDELEEYLLWYPSIFRMGPRELPGMIDQEDSDVLMSSLIWHCSAILLNRTFLPIPERCKLANEGQASLIRCVDFPQAPPLFLKERIHRCESSADAICDITQEIISKGGFFSHTLLLGYSCTQSALVLINRLHRSSKPYNKKVVENLKLIFIVLGAVRTFYSPAQAWIDALFRAHDINTPLSHVSGDVDLAFSSYFSRFVDIEEPAFVPLDPKECKDKSDAEVYPHEAPKEDGPTNGQGLDQPGSAEQSSTWLQTYVGHLAGDIHDDDDDMNGLASDLAEATQASLMDLATVAAGGARAGGNLAAQGGGAGMATNAAGVMMMNKGFTPCPDMMTGNGNANGRVTFPGDIDDLYPELFSQIPSLGDFIGMGHEIPIFPGLGSLMDGEDIWSDVLGNTMLQ